MELTEDGRFIINRIALLADVSLTAFIIYRNIRSGANTMTRAGLTSPGSGKLQNWPSWGSPEDSETVQSNPRGDSNPLTPPPALPPAVGP